jgi:hypothetical protein
MSREKYLFGLQSPEQAPVQLWPPDHAPIPSNLLWSPSILRDQNKSHQLMRRICTSIIRNFSLVFHFSFFLKHTCLHNPARLPSHEIRSGDSTEPFQNPDKPTFVPTVSLVFLAYSRSILISLCIPRQQSIVSLKLSSEAPRHTDLSSDFATRFLFIDSHSFWSTQRVFCEPSLFPAFPVF